MAASSTAIENAGKWSGSLPGCTTSAASSLDGNITSRTSSALSTLPAFTCCSDIYETGSRPPALPLRFFLRNLSTSTQQKMPQPSRSGHPLIGLRRGCPPAPPALLIEILQQHLLTMLAQVRPHPH